MKISTEIPSFRTVSLLRLKLHPRRIWIHAGSGWKCNWIKQIRQASGCPSKLLSLPRPAYQEWQIARIMARPKSTVSPISTVRLPLMWSQYPQKADVDTRTASTAKPRTDTRPPSVASQISLTLQYWTWTRPRTRRLGGRTRTRRLEWTQFLQQTQFLGRTRTRRLGGRTRTRRLERIQFLE